MVSDYIEQPDLLEDLALVFPKLKRSYLPSDPWSQSQITVERRPGIRDPSVIAIGADGKIAGARLDGFIADDLLDAKNTRTKERRDNTYSDFFSQLIPRLEPSRSRAIVTNTPWTKDDLTYRLENEHGWPTLTMDIYGYIRMSNVKSHWLAEAMDKYLRLSTTRHSSEFDWYRLKAFDPDPEETTPLWAERISAKRIDELRYGTDGAPAMPSFEFARTLLVNPLNEDALRCKREWLEDAKLRGSGLTFLTEYHGSNKVVTALDLGIGKKKKNDSTVFFTAMNRDDGKRQLVNIISGKYDGPTIVKMAIEIADRYNSMIVVENNSAQDYLRQFIADDRGDIVIMSHTTGEANKYAVDFGVESIFTEFQNGLWVIPSERGTGLVHPEISKFFDDCLYYQPPPAHTGDHLMAAWICREFLRKRFGGSSAPALGPTRKLIGEGSF